MLNVLRVFKTTDANFYKNLNVDDERLDVNLRKFACVCQNNVEKLRILSEDGDFNIRSDDKKTLLHFAIQERSKDAFNFLLPHVSLDLRDNDGNSALLIATDSHDSYFALKLIASGANIHVKNHQKMTPLHGATRKNLTDVVVTLLENGADPDVENEDAETPMLLALSVKSAEIGFTLLFYGAGITSDSLERALLESEQEFHESILNYIDEIEIKLTVLLKCVEKKLPVLPTLAGKISNLSYSDQELNSILETILTHADALQFLLDNFPAIIEELLENFSFCFLNLPRKSTENVLQCLDTLLSTDLRFQTIEFVGCLQFVIVKLSNMKVNYDTLSKFICCLLSHGFDTCQTEANEIFSKYGNCDLFKIMAHTNIRRNFCKIKSKACLVDDLTFLTVCSDVVSCKMRWESVNHLVMPRLICDVTLTVDSFINEFDRLSWDDLEVIFCYFAHPLLRGRCLERRYLRRKVKKVPSVPSLLEICRNFIRSFIVRVNNLKKFGELWVILYALPIGRDNVKILTYEKNLYCF